jgi:hypothetical protein
MRFIILTALRINVFFVIRGFYDSMVKSFCFSPVHFAIAHDKLILSSSVYLYWAVLLCFGLGLVFEKVGLV